jgi:transposase
VYGNAADWPERQRRYPSDMTDAEWAEVRPLLPVPGWMRGRGGRPEGYCHRAVLDAIRYLVDNGIKWRAMPADFPPWDRIYAFFRRWRDNALVKEFHDRLRARVREELGRDAQPSAGVIDSQSVKADAVVGADSRGFDGGKLINGRKRHVVVDTLGLLLGVMVTAADVGDRTAAQALLERVARAHHRLALVWADGGYTGSLVEHCLATFALVLAIVKRSDDMRGFVVLPKRWIVERLFAHLMRSRRLVRDFERRTASAEAMVYWSMTMVMTRRLARGVNRPGAGSASQPRATRRFAFDLSASTRAGTTSMPNEAAISWQVSGP